MNAPQIPVCFSSLFQPARYHVIYGGRGSGKSVNVAKALLIRGAQQPHRILCCRELQKSTRESVHQLLADEIAILGLEDFYDVQATTIRGINGTEFIFAGLKHNVNEIKSMQGVTICWVEEAQVVSKTSWDILIPTIRVEDSEFYITFNPVLEKDETFQRFVINPPPGALVMQVNWPENPFFPEVLRREMIHLRATDFDAYLHVWMGKCRHALEGAIFANEIRAAELGDRFMSVPYVQEKPVDLFFDLGRRDNTSIWFAQCIGMEFRIIDFYENAGHSLDHYIKVLQAKPYTYGLTWLPHDAEHDLLGSERTITQQMQAAKFDTRIVPNVSKASQIEAARAIFGRCFFDRERCADGIQHLRHYQYEVDVKTNLRSKLPLHDEHSHAADAFLYLGVALRAPSRNIVPDFVQAVPDYRPQVSGNWLGRT